VKLELRLFLVWVAIGVVLSLMVGGASGVLGWLGGERTPLAVLTGGVAFGGTLTLFMLVLKSFARPSRRTRRRRPVRAPVSGTGALNSTP
jgi:hypothetical protein